MKLHESARVWLLLTAVAMGGCGGPAPEPAARSKPTLDATPYVQIDKLVISVEPAASDLDNDGRPDTILSTCYLFRFIGGGTYTAVGKGHFRFEVFDGAETVEDRRPLSQMNLNYEQTKGYAVFNRMHGLICYRVPVPLGRLSPDTKSVVIVVHFFPEGGEHGLVAVGSAVPIHALGHLRPPPQTRSDKP